MVSQEVGSDSGRPYETRDSTEVSIGLLFKELRNDARPGVRVPAGGGMVGFA